MKSLVMTVLGADRPGLVDQLASAIAAHGGNWEESRMCRMGGQFAGIIRVTVPAGREAELRGSLASMDGLAVATCETAAKNQSPPPRTVSLGVLGQDRKGIVRQIAEVLARHAVNVEELHTECASAPMSGESLFRADAKVSIPQGCDLKILRGDLEKIASDLMVDISFAP